MCTGREGNSCSLFTIVCKLMSNIEGEGNEKTLLFCFFFWIKSFWPEQLKMKKIVFCLKRMYLTVKIVVKKVVVYGPTQA